MKVTRLDMCKEISTELSMRFSVWKGGKDGNNVVFQDPAKQKRYDRLRAAYVFLSAMNDEEFSNVAEAIRARRKG